MEWVSWFLMNIVMAPYNLLYALTHPQLWLNWSDGAAVMRVIYYGGSTEFFFVVFVTLIVLTTNSLQSGEARAMTENKFRLPSICLYICI